MGHNAIKEISYAFAVRIVNLHKHLSNEKREYVLSKQILRSGTSIGANVKEALQAESRADFVHKLAIALKESSETEYWLELLYDTHFINKRAFKSLYDDCQEILKVLTSIIKTTKQHK